MSLEFEWDSNKAAANLKKHGVAFDEALTVFRDPLALLFDDPDHSADEQREVIIASRRNRGFLWSALPSGRAGFGSSTRGARPPQNASNMAKTRRPRKRPPSDDLRPEYEFDYTKARPNRFASRFPRQTVAVVLEPDVAEVFSTSRSVNSLLRSVIKAVPGASESSTRRRKAG